jgi:UrcA family protein
MNTKIQNTSLSRLTATVLFSAMALSFAAISPAQDSTGVLREKVKYSDLDIARPAGAGALYVRITLAANDVCHQAIANAVAEVDQPALYSVYNAKNTALKPIMLAAGQSR